MNRSVGQEATSEAVRQMVMDIKAETPENKICADCKRIGKLQFL